MLTACLIGLGVFIVYVLVCLARLKRRHGRSMLPARRIIELNPDFIQKA